MTAILVPLALDVLMVRPGDPPADTADTAMRPIPEPDPGTAVRADPAPPPFGDRAARSPGAYLHWALPDGLAAAQPPPDAPPGTDPVFPPIPNRWLLVRLSDDAAAGPRALRAWLLPDVAAGDAQPLVVLPDQPDPPAPAEPNEPMTALLGIPLLDLAARRRTRAPDLSACTIDQLPVYRSFPSVGGP